MNGKYDGWRLEVHAPTSRAVNRQLEVSSVQHEFAVALAELRKHSLEFLDCEALSRRHAMGKGTLIVLDVIIPDATFLERQAILHREFPILNIGEVPKIDTVYAAPYFPQALPGSDKLIQQINERMGVKFYEGVVVKKNDSVYPYQLRNSEQICTDWVKHRGDQ